MPELRLGVWLDRARFRLKDKSDQAGLEASLLASLILTRPRSWVLAHPEELLSVDQAACLGDSLDRLLEGTPLPYITGVQDFYGLKFSVSPAVLIPRPETELLVEQALAWLRRNPARRNGLDVGTGSGCIPIALTAAVSDLHMTACDLSIPALSMAKTNAAAHAVSYRVLAVNADLTSPFAGPFDLVCANLPYIPSTTLETLEVARHEPLLALDGGPDGLFLIRRLLADLPRILAPGGLALLEIEARQGAAVSSLANQYFPGSDTQILQDLTGHDRLLRIASIACHD